MRVSKFALNVDATIGTSINTRYWNPTSAWSRPGTPPVPRVSLRDRRPIDPPLRSHGWSFHAFEPQIFAITRSSRRSVGRTHQGSRQLPYNDLRPARFHLLRNRCTVAPKVMHLTKDEFVELLNTRSVDWIVDNHVFGGPNFYSFRKPQVYRQMMSAISIGLQVPPTDIHVIGSARIGFSLSPNKFGERFNQYSDIDICVVSNSLFDSSWIDILANERHARTNLNPQTRQHLRNHREYHYVYNGWMYPGALVPVLRIGTRWMRTFNGLSRIAELATRSISGRLYRTWDHARLYHQWSLRRVKQTIDLPN